MACRNDAMKNYTFLPLLVLMTGCGASATSYVHSDETTLGRVVVYRNGVAYFERTADVQGDHLDLKVPADKVDDFLKSLTVVDAQTGKPAPISYPTRQTTQPGDPPSDGLIDMKIGLSTPTTHRLKLSYVTEAPSWKSSYRVVLGKDGKVDLQGWAIVDNTSGEDWKNVRLGVGSSSALSFRFDLQSIRLVERETLRSNDLFAYAPPTGGATYGQERKLVAELDDSALAPDTEEATIASASPAPQAADGRARKGAMPSAPPKSAPSLAAGGLSANGYGAGASSDPSQSQGLRAPKPKKDDVVQLARRLQGTQNQIVVEGFANASDEDKQQTSFDRANRLRDQLVQNGVDPNKIVAVGRGIQSGRTGGARVVENNMPVMPAGQAGPGNGDQKNLDALGKNAPPADPIGTSNFESGNVTSVARGSSAMVSILTGPTDGEVVYLYDPDGQRGNAQFPFKSVRLKNPSDSVLETGPVTVFGDGRFIGEGMAEPIPAHSTAFVPFALDRQIVVERTTDAKDEVARLLTVQRGVFSAEVQHKKKVVYSLSNRLADSTVVYVRHVVEPGYKLSKVPDGAGEEKLGNANLLRVVLPAHAKVEVAIEESTPIFRSVDVRTPEGIEQVRVYLSGAAVDPALKDRVNTLLALNKDMADVEQQITTIREQMVEYRSRMDELHNQIFTLKAVRTAGPLMASLEKKMQDVSDRLSKATLDVVGAQEKLMVARVHFQDGVAELSLDPAQVKDKRDASVPPSKTASAK